MKTGGHLYPTPWARAWEQIDADFDAHLDEIRRFLRRPTVSASDDDLLAGAEDVATLIEGAGGSAEILNTAGHPAVLEEGVYFAPRCFMNTSTAMDEQVIDEVLEACSRAMARVVDLLASTGSGS